MHAFATEEEVYALPRLRRGSRPSCARTAASSRRRATASCRSSSSSATCAATCTRTRPGRTARTRSRRWSRRAVETGYAYYAICDHSHRLRDERLEQQARGDRRAERARCPLRILKGIEVNIRADGDARRRRRGPRDARLGRRLGAQLASTTTRPSACSRRWRTRTSTASATSRTARSASARRRRVDVERVIEKALETGHVPRDQLAARPARPHRRPRARRARGRAEARDRLRRPPGLGARLRRARRRPGAARVADEGRRRSTRARWKQIEKLRKQRMTLPRRPRRCAADWVAPYLETRRRAAGRRRRSRRARCARRCPTSPPEHGEPFADVLRDLDELIAAGAHALEPPALLRVLREHGLGAGDPRRAADRGAERERDGVARARRPRPSSSSVVLDWLAQLLGLPRGWHGHIEDTASTVDDRRARRGPRRCGPAASSTRPSTRTSPSRRPRGSSGSSSARSPVDDEFRMRTGLPARRRDRGRRDGRHDRRRPRSTRCRSSPTAARRRASGCTSTRRTRARRRSARSCAGASTACDRADSIVVNPHKWLFTPMDCSALWTRRPEALHERVRARAATTSPRPRRAVDLRDYGPALGRRFRALKLWTVLRWYGARGPAGADPRARPPRAALRGAGCAAEPGWEVVAPRHFSTVCFRHAERRQRRARARARPRRARSSSRRRSCAAQDVIRLAIGNARTTGGRRPPRVGGAARMRAVIFDLWDTLVDWDREAARRACVGRASPALGGDRVRRALARELPRLATSGPLARRCSPSAGVPAEAHGRTSARAARVRPPLPRAAAGRASRRSRELRERGHLGRADHGLLARRSSRSGPRPSSPGSSTPRCSRRESGSSKPDPRDLPRTARALGVEPPTASSSATARTTSWRRARASG